MQRAFLPAILRMAVLGLLSAFFAPAVDEGASARAADDRQVVIPFDFVSQFDDGRYGQMVGDMIWKKLEREKGFIIPETMLDVREFCQRNKLAVGPDTPLEQVKKIVREDFGADIGIWGSVERAPGHRWEVYDLTIKCVDFSVEPDPKVIYEKTNVQTKAVSEIPHLYVKAMLDTLYGRGEEGTMPANVFEEENWKNGPNLVEGGDFESGVRGVPKGWESMGGHVREPLGGLVKWIPEVGNSQNHVIRFTFDKALGDSFGVLYYSDFFPIEEGAKYRFQCRYRSNGPKAKVFIKCYDLMSSEYVKNPGYKPTAAKTRKKGANDYVPEEGQRREVYRSQQNLEGPRKQWNTQTEDFTPKHTKYTPRWGRVMLYAYLGAGVVEFDDVVLKQILPASPSEQIKTGRHSLETKVTIKEMEENERRGRELQERRRREQMGQEPEE